MSSVVMSDAAARLHQLELQAALERDMVNQRTNDEILHLKTTFQSNVIRLNLIRCNISEDDYSRMVADLKSRCSKDLEKIQGKRRSELKIIDLQLNFQLTMLENEEIRRKRQVEYEAEMKKTRPKKKTTEGSREEEERGEGKDGVHTGGM